MEYHADRFADYSLMAFNGEELLAVLPANISGQTITSHGGLTFGGWVTSHSMRAAKMVEIFERAKEVMAFDASKLVYKPAPSIYHREPSDEDLYALTRSGATLVRRDIASALRPAPVSGKIRRDNKSCVTKFGLVVTETDDFETFHGMLADVLVRHDSRPVHTVDELRLLKSRFPDQIRLFGTFHEGNMVAGALCFDNGHVCHTQYLANPEQGRAVRGLDVLIAHLIETEFADRAWFSFGISTEDGGRVLNEGLIGQKEKFGARGIVHDFYEVDLRS